MKTCPKCEERLPLSSFARNRSRSDGLQSYCRACMTASHRAWQQKSKLHLNQYMKGWRETHRDSIRETNSAQYEKNKEARKAKQREYYRANVQEHLARNRNRKAQKRDAAGSHTAADILDIYKTQKGKCRWCGVEVGSDFHVDHVVPLSRGGSDSPENLAVACPDCNRHKHNAMPDEWVSRAKSCPQAGPPRPRTSL